MLAIIESDFSFHWRVCILIRSTSLKTMTEECCRIKSFPWTYELNHFYSFGLSVITHCSHCYDRRFTDIIDTDFGDWSVGRSVGRCHRISLIC
jgi:hypothetical protein